MLDASSALASMVKMMSVMVSPILAVLICKLTASCHHY